MTFQSKKTLIASSLTIIFEWYDFALYGFLAPVIAKLFFPSEDKVISLLATFGVFALSFFMRPFGGLIFGHIGDKVGRKKALIYSVSFMAISTTLIGFLPTYNQIGILAPLLLIILKLAQGLSVGGERSSSISFLIEHAAASNRGFYGSCTLCSTTAGILLASGVVAAISTILSDEQLSNWGWRIPFLFGFIAGIVLLYLRKNTEEPQIFKNLHNQGNVSNAPLLEAISSYWKAILTTLGATLLISVGFYMIFVYIPTFLSTQTTISLSSALKINTICMIALMILIPIMGLISDKIGRRILLISGSLGISIITYFIFKIFSLGDVLYSFLGQLSFAIIYSIIVGPFAATMFEHFPTKVRMSGLSLGFGLGFAVFGGTTPFIATYLVNQTGNPIAPSMYLIVCSLISLFIFINMRETYKISLE